MQSPEEGGGSPELELQIVVSLHVVARNHRPGPVEKKPGYLLSPKVVFLGSFLANLQIFSPVRK